MKFMGGYYDSSATYDCPLPSMVRNGQFEITLNEHESLSNEAFEHTVDLGSLKLPVDLPKCPVRWSHTYSNALINCKV